MAVKLEIVRQLVERAAGTAADLPLDWRIDFEERAAILEYDGGLTGDDAERQALKEIWSRIGVDG